MSMRISGLASGMDIDSIISDLMKIQRVSVDKKIQQRIWLEWQRDAYREMNAKILDYRNNKIADFRLESTFDAKKVTVSNSSAISAKALGSAQQGTISIKVEKLANSASKLSSESIVEQGKEFKSGNLLKDELNANNLKGSLNLDINDENANKFTVSINGYDVEIDLEKDSLDTIIQRINKQTNVTAFYDSVTGKMSFIAKNADGQIQETVNGETLYYIDFDDKGTGFFTDLLKLGNSHTANAAAGNDAKVTINGLTTYRSSNTFTVNGVEITLRQETGNEVVQIGVATDVDAIIEKIKQFVNDYNEFIAPINSKLNEKRYRDYAPLTESQKKDMKEREIELWEEKAKSGLLRSDSILSSLITDMRKALYSRIDTGKKDSNGDPIFISLSSIGITTGNYLENGKLYVDENKLREALEADLDSVKKLFTAKGDSNGEGKGIAVAMYDHLWSAINKISEKAGTSRFSNSELLSEESTMGRQLKWLNQEIDRANKRMLEMEQRYYRQFAAMESAINKYNAQSMYLMNAFGG